MNAQKQAAAAILFAAIVTSNSKKERQELLKQQFLFEATVNGVARKVAHGEFFGLNHPPFEGVVETKAGIAARDVEGGMLFIPFEIVAPAPAVAPAVVEVPVAVEAPAAVVAPKLISTISRRVGFGEIVEIYNSLFQLVEIFETPSSGAMVQQLLSDGSKVIRFTGIIEKTWTI